MRYAKKLRRWLRRQEWFRWLRRGGRRPDYVDIYLESYGIEADEAQRGAEIAARCRREQKRCPAYFCPYAADCRERLRRGGSLPACMNAEDEDIARRGEAKAARLSWPFGFRGF